MKTPEELNELKKQYEELNEKCRELTPEELEQVTGGVLPDGNKSDGVLPGNDKIGIIGEEYSLVGELPAL